MKHRLSTIESMLKPISESFPPGAEFDSDAPYWQNNEWEKNQFKKKVWTDEDGEILVDADISYESIADDDLIKIREIEIKAVNKNDQAAIDKKIKDEGEDWIKAVLDDSLKSRHKGATLDYDF